MVLPTFRYHPDPLSTGSIEESENTCGCCGESRGYIYTGPVYTAEELHAPICPWCIASGAAHARFNAEFVDAAAVGDHGSWAEVPPSDHRGGCVPGARLLRLAAGALVDALW